MARQSPPRYSPQPYDRNTWGVYDHNRCEWVRGQFHVGRTRRSKAANDAKALNEEAAKGRR